MNAWEYDHFNKAVCRIEQLLLEIKKQGEHQMSELDDRITTIQTAVAQLGTDLTAAIADLKAKIGAGQPTDAQLSALDAIATSLTSLDTQAKAE
jgi:hypothetical protein